mmetsp:Transcript_63280/g.139168  ORF Transcript_63280/g.139168 Transcript_63280/m.139168 type:complete len:229 (-) Transcript_63280:224-910(-)
MRIVDRHTQSTTVHHSHMVPWVMNTNSEALRGQAGKGGTDHNRMLTHKHHADSLKACAKKDVMADINQANIASTSLHTLSMPGSELTLFVSSLLAKSVSTGTVSSWKVVNRFLMVSMLSSLRPLVLPRLSNRSSITFSEHSMRNVNLRFTLLPRRLSHTSKLATLRGKPSMRYFPPQPCRFISSSTRPTVISDGINCPSFKRDSMSSAFSDPGRARSALIKSPALSDL